MTCHVQVCDFYGDLGTKGNCKIQDIAGTLQQKQEHNMNWKPLNLQTGSMVRQVVLTASHPCYKHHPWLNQKKRRENYNIIYYTTKLQVTDRPLRLYLAHNHTLHLHILSTLTTHRNQIKSQGIFFLSFSAPEDRQNQSL